MQVEGLNATVINYINELKENYEHQLNESVKTCNELKVSYEKKNTELENKLKQSEIQYDLLNEKYKLLLFHRFSQSSEKYRESKEQLLLFNEKGSLKDKLQQETEITEIKSYQRKKCGRKPLDPNLVRDIEIIDIPEEEKICACGAHLTKIGEESSEKLHIIPQKIYVVKTIRPKYACRRCEGTADEEEKAVKIAPVPPTIIPRSIASADLLSFIMIHKYQDHIPYYRQETQFKRLGIHISRQDMSNWQQQVYAKLEPLFDVLKAAVKSGPVLQMDETPVQVMGEKDREDTQKSYMWLARGGPPDKKVTWYEYFPNRAGSSALGFLDGYKGFLQTDGYKTYDSVLNTLTGITHVGCFAHVRRKFFEATKVNDNSPSAEKALLTIKMLYDIENSLRKRELTHDVFLEERKSLAEPILNDFKLWLLRNEKEVLPSSQAGKAVAYALNQWDKLIRYLESPYLTPDNNACENAIRPFVLGRKNWLFNKSPEGAKSSCGMYTLIETAKQNNIEPLSYLRILFEKAPFAVSPIDWEKLLPWNLCSN
jgi:transposase